MFAPVVRVPRTSPLLVVAEALSWLWMGVVLMMKFKFRHGVLTALLLVIGSTAFNGATALFASAPTLDSHFRNEPFQFDPSDEVDEALPSQGHQAPVSQVMRLQEKLIFISEYYGSMDYVPYIWGGGNIGKKDACQACRKCVQQKGVSLKNRLTRCSACQSCGIDCSHFVNMVYNQVGLDFPYASTAELRRLRPEDIAAQYNLLDMGKDIRVVQPGDLLVYRNHVVMAIAPRANGRGDFIHATRFGGGLKQIGGIRLERDRKLLSFRGKLMRILRHRKFFEAYSPLLSEESPRKFVTPDQWSPFSAVFLEPLGPFKRTTGLIQR